MEVDFIVVDSYSPYTTIVAIPWLHALGAVSSTLHQKMKYPSEGLVKEILGNQSVARQCMVADILHKPEVLIAIKSLGFIRGRATRGGELRRLGKSDN